MLQRVPFQTYIDFLGPQVLVADIADNPCIRGVSADSRAIGEGDLFVAVPGSHANGVDYVNDAVAAGARAIVAEVELDLPHGTASAIVRDAYAAVGLAAEVCYGFPASKLNLTGVTGTNGKTTVVSLLHHILSTAGRCSGLISTIQYCLGPNEVSEADRTTPMPVSFQRLLARMLVNDVRDVVMEVSSHALDQRRCGRSPFVAGAFTNLTQDHLDYHKDMNAYFEAKKLLFTEGIKPHGLAVINTDDPYGERLIREIVHIRPDLRCRSFGTDSAADVVMRDVRSDEHGGVMALFESDSGRTLSIATPLPGRYNLYNTATAVILAREAGVPDQVTVQAVRTYGGTPGRLERIQGKNGPTAFVDYAHTADALDNVLRTLAEVASCHLAVVCGCGGDRDKEKRPQMARVAQELADRVYLTSDNPRYEVPERILEDMAAGLTHPCSDVRLIVDRREAIQRAVADACPGDIILIAGKGHEPYQEVAGRKYTFDDRIEVRRAMNLDHE